MRAERDLRCREAPDRVSADRRAHREPRSPVLLDLLVTSILEDSNRPLSAYDIVRRGSDREVPLQPAQVYRVLDRLIRRGKVQRIELLSAYLIVPGEQYGVMICRRCRAVETFSVSCLADQTARLCAAERFSMTRAVLEASGLCEECERRTR